jgi:DNA polymerase phi
MFDKNASHGRKFWGFQLVERVLPRLSSEQMTLIFTANFMRTFINNLSSDVRFLNKAARHTVS